ncbi:unnamed protein product [Meganyctiphanes norvegica]|uniref:Leucine zipper transcription factor-like protein 1 n=1 Tax=Meganyctiphanes norvegica TaxID=48144 RepID=A0AAV2R5F7_MEGNR
MIKNVPYGYQPSDLGLNEHHRGSLAGYFRFCKYQRQQRLRSIDACFHDAKDTRLNEDTYTCDEVIELLESLASVVRAEVEGELIHQDHTNSLLLSQLFTQAQKWHLDLIVDTGTLENKELLEDIAKFEDSSQSGRLDDLAPQKKTLAPLGDTSAPTQLLHAEILRLTEANKTLNAKFEEAQAEVVELGKVKSELSLNIQSLQSELITLKDNVNARPTTDDVTQLSNEVEIMRLEMLNQGVQAEGTQSELGQSLNNTRQQLLKIQSQLQLAEKELDKKFSQTGGYLNMKKMLTKKNEQIRSLRKKLSQYEPEEDEPTEE